MRAQPFDPALDALRNLGREVIAQDAQIVTVTAERDRARDTAAWLEQELAHIRDTLETARDNATSPTAWDAYDHAIHIATGGDT